MSRVQASALIGVALAIALFVSLLQARGVAQEATPAADCPATTPEENKELVDRWFAALSGGTSDDVAELAAADIVYHDPSPREEVADRWHGGVGKRPGRRTIQTCRSRSSK